MRRSEVNLLENQGLVIGKDVHLARFGSDPPYFTSGMWLVEKPHLEMGRAAARLCCSSSERAAWPPGTPPPSTSCWLRRCASRDPSPGEWR